jgi:DNA-binding NtrC family response regulator
MSSQPVNILMVEDNPGDARLLQEYLAEGLSDYSITHCGRLREAVAWLDGAHTRCDVILLDLTLPDSNGLGTFIDIHDRAATVPIVILSGFNDNTLACQAVQKGAQDYIPKDSLDADQLARTIRYAIERKQWEETNRQRDERITRMEKMEAIGRLSGGIAHNFNNILTAIIGNCELLRRAWSATPRPCAMPRPSNGRPSAPRCSPASCWPSPAGSRCGRSWSRSTASSATSSRCCAG